MTLSLDQFAKASRVKRPPCTVTLILAQLDPKDVALVTEALDNRSITGKAIADVLSNAGHPISQGSVTRHRRGDCSCERTT